MQTESYRNGWIAHRKRAPVQDNPYDEVTQAISHAWWTSGWCERFNAAKHGRLTDAMDQEMMFRE